VVAYAEKMAGGFEIASVLMTQGIIGQSLEKFVPKHFARIPDRQELVKRRAWIRQLAGLVRRFHQAGFCHRDLYLSHIFICFKKNGHPVFYLIDLARAFKTGWRKNRWIVKDLAALNYSAPGKTISATDRMRFFNVYQGVTKIGEKDKNFLREIAQKSRRIALHDAKHRKKTEERVV
jgi:tRNA A-37 threonylcarbamoyl transferase component Bud32